MSLLFRSFLISLSFVVVGCSELGYYKQATVGQLSLLADREPIETILNDEATPKKLKSKLELILRARAFAEDHLALPAGEAYLDYVDLQQRYVIWNITAAEEFSLEGKAWCYPFVGCQTYRGYFAEEDANAFAAGLKKEGYDVHVSGVTAYSTLGWFDDPVLNTFVYRNDASLASLIFHELAHRVVYIDGDTAFNESFATAVELAGLKLWLQQHNQSGLYQVLADRKAIHRQFTNIVLSTNKKLKALYQQPLNAADMRSQKASLIEEMRGNYRDLSRDWAFRGYDHWFKSEINNAKLITVANYHDFVPAFLALLEKNDHDYVRFYQEVERLGALPRVERIKALSALSDTAENWIPLKPSSAE